LAAPQDSPTGAPRPRPESDPIILVIGGPIARARIPRICERVRVLLEGSHADQVVCDVGGLVDPDAVAVDALARLQLTARRLGRRIGLRHASGELQELLTLMGLGDVLPLSALLPLEPRGQAEEREQARGVEEEADPADPTG
jgi:ABC-type transporter Mla MlaB component